MKNKKMIIYDDNCPLCAAYTGLFVSAGMITKENRKNFSTIDPTLLSLVDTKRCKNEIPVIDTQTKEIWYGIEAMAEILQSKIPFTKKLVQLKFVNRPLNQIYKLISYNRRVIVATKTRTGNFDCSPDFNYRYRFAFMFLFLLFNTAMLFPIHSLLLNNSFIRISSGQLQQAHFILVLLNIALAVTLDVKTAFEYLGQINMLALTTILMTLPLLILNNYHIINLQGINNIYILLLMIFVFREYSRRMSFAEIIPGHPAIAIINIAALLIFILYLIR